MSRKICCLTTCLAMIGLAGMIFAQPPGMPQPSPEHGYFKKMVGTWDCTMKMGPQESKATARYRMIGGFWLVGNFNGDIQGMKFEGHETMGWDPKKKKYVGTWMDSMSPYGMNMESELDSSKKTMTATGDAMNMEGKMAKFKMVSEWKNDDEMTMTMYEEKGGKMEQQFSIDYKRRAGGEAK